MSSRNTARERVLENIRAATAVHSKADKSKTSASPATDTDTGIERLHDSVAAHLEKQQRHTMPAFAGNPELTARLIDQMSNVQMTVTRLQTTGDVPAAVEEYLREQGIDGDLVVAPEINNLDWPDDTQSGTARQALERGRELTSVTPCLCAVAESGSVVTYSSSTTPCTLNYLPDNHIVVLHEDQVVGHLEDALALQRSKSESAPRAVNFLTGPSRTADIEQTLELGAHGPRRMHVLLIAQTGAS